MKKILSVLLLSFSLFALNASDWSWNVLLGLGVPVNRYSVTNYDNVKVKQTGLTFDATALLINDNGFTLDFGGAAGLSKNDDSDEKSFYASAKFGVGFTPVNTERFGLTFSSLVACDYMHSSYTYSYYMPMVSDSGFFILPYTEKENFDSIGIAFGGELATVFRFTEKFGLFADFGVRYSPFTRLVVDGEGVANARGWDFVPAFGAALKF